MASALKRFGEDKFFSPDEDVRNLPVAQLEGDKLQNYHVKLDYAVVFTKFCVLVSGKMLVFQRSEWRLFPSVFAATEIISVSVFLFSLAYYATYKASPTEFEVQRSTEYFDFLFFSFNNLGFNSIEQVKAVGIVSRSVFMLQCSVFIFVLAVFVSSFASARDQVYGDKLAEVAGGFQRLAREMKIHITEKFGRKSFEDAVDALLRVKSGLLVLFLKLSGEALAAAEEGAEEEQA